MSTPLLFNPCLHRHISIYLIMRIQTYHMLCAGLNFVVKPDGGQHWIFDKTRGAIKTRAVDETGRG